MSNLTVQHISTLGGPTPALKNATSAENTVPLSSRGGGQGHAERNERDKSWNHVQMYVSVDHQPSRYGIFSNGCKKTQETLTKPNDSEVCCKWVSIGFPHPFFLAFKSTSSTVLIQQDGLEY